MKDKVKNIYENFNEKRKQDELMGEDESDLKELKNIENIINQN